MIFESNWCNDYRKSALSRLNTQQIKYYNISHQSKSYVMNDLMLLSTKDFKQKRLSKKLSHKFVDSFRMKNKIDEQTYRLTLLNIYRIYNIFHMLFLKSYLHRVDNSNTKIMIQVSKFINDIEQWEIKKIMNRIRSKKKIWYKVKWLDWNYIYNQWLSEKELKYVQKLKQQFNEQMTSRKRCWKDRRV